MPDYPKELIDKLTVRLMPRRLSHDYEFCRREAIDLLAEFSRTHTILPNSDYADLLARSEKLRSIEWQMSNPCQNCGGDCLECQHYDDKRRHGY